jgi:hypothetical protein
VTSCGDCRKSKSDNFAELPSGYLLFFRAAVQLSIVLSSRSILPLAACAAVAVIVSLALASSREAEARVRGGGSATAATSVSDGMPHYLGRAFDEHEKALLRDAFGIDDPRWLYLADTTESGILEYDTQQKRCQECLVNSYRVGLVSVRRFGESWVDFEARIRHLRLSDFGPSAKRMDVSLDDLDPEAGRAFRDLIDAGRRAGFKLSVRETYRSPEREAMLLALGRGRTHTATSSHSYGRAVDIFVGDGYPRHKATRAAWIRFRQFVLAQDGQPFRLIGRVNGTWDWGHVELREPVIGFRSIDEALAFAARCTSDSARANPPTSAELGGGAPDPCVFVPNLHGRS